MLKVKVLLQLFNKSKLKNKIKTFVEPAKIFSLCIVKFKKLGFSTPLSSFKYMKKSLRTRYFEQKYYKLTSFIKASFEMVNKKCQILGIEIKKFKKYIQVI